MPEQILTNVFKKLNISKSEIQLPTKFTYPFSYSPHQVSEMACADLQNYLENQKDFTHDFGLDANSDATGKMFGVLVVENEQKELGYIAAFSEKLADQYHLDGFVSPVYDMEIAGAFYTKGMRTVANLDAEISVLENDKRYLQLLEALDSEHKKAKEDLTQTRTKMDQSKAERKDNLRFERLTLSSGEYDQLCVEYSNKNAADYLKFERLEDAYQNKIDRLDDELDPLLNALDALIALRDHKQSGLQEELFSQFRFSNITGSFKTLQKVFKDTQTPTPPEGAGECATPKLLQYAFLNKLKPIAMAQFWWGNSPTTLIRQHKEYYPACMGKCHPILTHMLEGMEVDENPHHTNKGTNKKIEILYEDGAIAVINKPVDVLSVPGRVVEDSVYTRMLELYPKATGPIIVHRLDQATSGVMLIAKTKKAHKRLQKQFIDRTIKKQYVALLDGLIAEDEGTVDLPLRLDYINRPQQVVCHETGKPAQTNWSVLKRTDKQTRVLFTPITGRTHQLRVHAAHKKGLNTPILGDDIYGRKGERLHLHALFISFTHPITKKAMEFTVEAAF